MANAETREQHWKTKYLDFLEEHEQEQSRQEDLIRVLRRGLLSVSLVGDGLDPELDSKLTTLRASLQKLENKSPGLDDLVQAIETDLLRMDSQRNQEAVALKFTLSKSIAELIECKALHNSDYLKTLKRMQKEVRKSSEDRSTQHGLLKDFAAVLTAMVTNTSLETASSGKQKGFWQRLTLSLLQPEEEKKETAPVKDEPTQSEPEKQSKSGPELNSEPNSEIAGPSLPDTDDNVVKQVSEFISQVVELLAPVDAISAVTNNLRKELKQASASEIPLLLQKTLNVVNMAHANEQKRLKDYLKSVHDSLEDLGSLVNKSQSFGKQRADLDRKLDSDLRFDLDSITDQVKNAKDLQHLKVSIQDKLDNMLCTVDAARDARQEAEQVYSDDIRQLISKVEFMEKESRELNESVKKQQAAMRLDSLTSLNNRNAYFEKIAEEFEVWKATDDQLCLCLGDIDYLHKLNEAHGHSIGDKAIQLIAQELNTRKRKSDFLARYGGEQFVMILPATTAEVALDAMESNREHIGRCKFKCKDSTLSITMSFGITEFSQGDTLDTAFTRVEDALLQAKNSGRNCCRVNRGH